MSASERGAPALAEAHLVLQPSRVWAKALIDKFDTPDQSTPSLTPYV
jgi:hypothetical protein